MNNPEPIKIELVKYFIVIPDKDNQKLLHVFAKVATLKDAEEHLEIAKRDFPYAFIVKPIGVLKTYEESEKW